MILDKTALFFTSLPIEELLSQAEESPLVSEIFYKTTKHQIWVESNLFCNIQGEAAWNELVPHKVRESRELGTKDSLHLTRRPIC